MIRAQETSALARTLSSLVVETARGRWATRGLSDDERLRAQAKVQQTSAVRFCRASRLVVEVGRPIPDTPALLVANHLGAWDGFAIAATHPMAIAAKEEVDAYPIVGAMTRTFGVLLVPRGRPAEAGGFVDRVQERLRAGVSVLVFAEGTTGDGSELLPFKTGAFESVAGTEWPVVPVVQLPVRWGRGQQPAGEAVRRCLAWQQGASLGLHAREVAAHLPLTIRVSAGAPISSAGKNRKQLARETHQAVADLIEAP
jgi:1-acyl-sn-glycerol-3-phosphate acyltransferase